MRSIDIRYLYLDIDKILNKISSNSRAYYKLCSLSNVRESIIKCKRQHHSLEYSRK